MIKAKCSFNNEEDIKKYIAECEENFERRLTECVDKVRTSEGIKLIGLSGPSCAGKTTLSKKLISNFAEYGRSVHTVSIDDFYRDREYLVKRSEELGHKTVDFDSIDTIDFEELCECIREIFTEEETLVPIFDFNVGKRVGFKKIAYTDGELFIFEGIQAIYPEITEVFRRYPYQSMFICPMSSIDYDGEVFEPNEIRLMRRIVRDYKFRSSSFERTLGMWEGVRENEEINIFPYVKNCGVVIDSTIPYEMNILAPYLRDIISDIGPNDRFYDDARQMYEKISGIQGISDKYIGKNALYHEFVG